MGGGASLQDSTSEDLVKKSYNILKLSNKVYSHWHLDKISNHITKLKYDIYTSFSKKCCNFNITMQYTILFRLEIMTKDAKVHLCIKVVLQLSQGGYFSKVTSNLINRLCAGFQFIKVLLLQVSTLYTAINKAMAMFIYFFLVIQNQNTNLQWLLQLQMLQITTLILPYLLLRTSLLNILLRFFLLMNGYQIPCMPANTFNITSE